ncbi:beta-glucuronidase [Zootermopsis nevadensis]|nr:beta-glucuronidase [Zootermopsis nevadensis]XP_021938963.1 beta-glucuronidase [Zootermopsis nevadensis]XP_021938964.1 beta-glucuronidase [Zootermopsis nevadensis]
MACPQLLLLGYAAVGLVLSMAHETVSRANNGGILYPQESESRDVRSLDGLWNFRLSPEPDPLTGFRERWFQKDLSQTGETIPMPVPASYNDITEDKTIRDHVGLVWYDRTFYVPEAWRQSSLVWLRFGSVHYAAQVWVNGHLVLSHEIGHLPFQADITSVVKFGAKNRITVAVDNILHQTTVPQGHVSEVNTDNGTRIIQTYTFDFFNYAGIHRSVHLYTTPSIYIDDISVHTGIRGDTGIIMYNVTYGGLLRATSQGPACYVDLLDRDGNYIIRDAGSGQLQGELEVPVARLWWPYLMDPEPGYMYTLQVRLSAQQWGIEDIYRVPVGIRTVEWNNTSILINGRPIYLRGFGRHEDSDLRGKGLDYALIVKDNNLIKWVGANSYRTSHYPYAEEIMDFADREGIIIIDECPSVDTENYSPALLEKHKDSLTQLIRRDKNRPSVIFWSIANEARTQLPVADSYFRAVVEHVRYLDSTRPITMAIARGSSEDRTGQYLDVIGFNRYNGWYSNTGRTDTIYNNVIAEATSWHHKYNKPVMMMEYGADTLTGLHMFPEYVWSEEYQVEVMSKHFEAFDRLRAQGFFVGEMIWNFADFKTAQTITRVGGNKKGIFTRNRQPKSSAHHIRRRYWALAGELDKAVLPKNLNHYVSKS